MKVKYFPEVEEIKSDAVRGTKYVNRVEILGIPLVVYVCNVENKFGQSIIKIQFCTPDLKVVIKNYSYPEAYVLFADFLSTKEQFAEWVIEKSTKDLLILFENVGKEEVERKIQQKLAEWAERKKQAGNKVVGP